tara:strand:+ start:37 stop:1938 length:1902 start_codon:yes stop_codon:yes gene_type:complete
MKRFLATFLLFGILLSNQHAWSSWITKKSDTSEKVASIEKEYADGLISKSECNKQKSKVLKLNKISETICDNVKVKVAQSSWIKKKSKEEVKKEKSNYIEKKEKETKKEFVKKKKNLSKSIKKWITKKKTKDKRHYNSIAQLPKSDYYFTAVDGSGSTFIGYFISTDYELLKKYEIEVDKDLVKESEIVGQVFQDDGKTQCPALLEKKGDKQGVIRGDIYIKCPIKEYIGSWTQTGSQGFGNAFSSEKTRLQFNFSKSRNDVYTYLSKNKKNKKLVLKDKKSDEIKDSICPEIKLVDNKQVFTSSDCKTKVAKVQAKDGNFSLMGFATDNEEVQRFSVDGRPIKLKSDGSFKYNGKTNSSKDVYLVATDKFGKITEMKVSIEVLAPSKKFVNNKKYYALVIGNSEYKHWDNLVSPVNDAEVIATVLKEKYNFEIPILLKNADKASIEEAFFKMNKILTEDDYLLIYYAGHGDKNPSIQKAYWIPTNAGSSFDRNWISTSFVTEMIGTFKAKHVLLMVDSCYSGLLKSSNSNLTEVDGDTSDNVFLTKLLNRKTRLFISSGSDEPVLDSSDDKHSWFAKKFIELLKSNNNTFTSRELYIKIDRYVQSNASQRPKYDVIKETGHNEGRFLFTSRN